MADSNDTAPIPTSVAPTGPQIVKLENDGRFDLVGPLWLALFLVFICLAFFARQNANFAFFSFFAILAATAHYNMRSPEIRTTGKQYAMILVICLIFIRLQYGDFYYCVCYTHLAGAADSHLDDYTAPPNPVTDVLSANRATPIARVTSCRIVEINPSRIFGFHVSEKVTGDCIRRRDSMNISRKQVEAS